MLDKSQALEGQNNEIPAVIYTALWNEMSSPQACASDIICRGRLFKEMKKKSHYKDPLEKF
jgi:hypothetical protein